MSESAAPAFTASRRRRLRLGRREATGLAIGGTAAIVVALAAAVAGSYRYSSLAQVEFAQPRPSGRKSGREIERELAALAPRGPYITVDTAENRLYLKRGEQVLREAICSAGTGAGLEDPESGRRWVFETPRGARRIQTKIKDPVWREPDWSFIEEGEPIPKDYSERFESGMLGEYAMSLGGGYLIHGTLYERLLGRNVTHGCIRVSRDDLRLVAKTVRVGDRVYIF
jgi:L,D-transpeptidase YbiS